MLQNSLGTDWFPGRTRNGVWGFGVGVPVGALHVSGDLEKSNRGVDVLREWVCEVLLRLYQSIEIPTPMGHCVSNCWES